MWNAFTEELIMITLIQSNRETKTLKNIAQIRAWDDLVSGYHLSIFETIMELLNYWM
jgi:hypothetical protein